MNVESIAVIGECMVELRFIDGSLDKGYGGDTLNTATYLSRLTQFAGINVSYVTGLGNDPFSREMLDIWKGEGINTEMVCISKDRLPGIYAIETAEDGERSFHYWRESSAAKYWLRDFTPDEVVLELSKHQIIYLSGISLAILPNDCRDSLLAILIEIKKQESLIVFDNNYRPSIWADRRDAQSWYEKILKITDIAFLTYDDEQLLWGDEVIEQSIQRTLRFGVDEIIIKRGGEGCIAIADKERLLVKPDTITNIVDTTAAGDSFSAGYLAKRISGGTIEESTINGHRLAGEVIQHHGAVIPVSAMPIM